MPDTKKHDVIRVDYFTSWKVLLQLGSVQLYEDGSLFGVGLIHMHGFYQLLQEQRAVFRHEYHSNSLRRN